MLSKMLAPIVRNMEQKAINFFTNRTTVAVQRLRGMKFNEKKMIYAALYFVIF